MTTTETFTPNPTMTLLLGVGVLISSIALLVMVTIGLRALLLGRDHACVFSLRFALELLNHVLFAGRAVRHIHHLPVFLSDFATPSSPRPIADRGFFREVPLLYIRLSFMLLRRRLRRVHTRRAIKGTSYQTYGARIRTRTAA